MALNRGLDGRDNLRRAGKSLSKTAGDGSSSMLTESLNSGSVFERRFSLYASEGHRLPFWALRNDHLWTSRSGNPLNRRSKARMDGSGRSFSQKITSDVDFVFANGSNVVFVDVKGYAANRFYWTAWFAGDYRIREGMFGFKKAKSKNGSGGSEETVQSLSRSMDMAVNQYSELLPEASITALLLFVPVGKVRSGDLMHAADPRKLPSSVSLLRAPGGVKSYKQEQGFSVINRLLGSEEATVPKHIQTVFDQHAMH